MDIQFTGKIIAALPIQQGTSKRDGQPWAKQEYVIEEFNQRYPSRCCFQVFGTGKIQTLNIQLGEVITAHLAISANQSQDGSGRWFNQLDCWKVERFVGQQPQQPQDQVVQSVAGMPRPVYQQPVQQFSSQGNQAGQPINQQPQYGGGQQGNIPFPK